MYKKITKHLYGNNVNYLIKFIFVDISGKSVKFDEMKQNRISFRIYISSKFMHWNAQKLTLSSHAT